MASWAGSSGPRAAAGGAAAELRLVSLTVRRSRAGGGLREPPAAGAGVPLARLRCSLRAWALIPEKQPGGVSRARPPVPGSGHRSGSCCSPLRPAGLGEPQESAHGPHPGRLRTLGAPPGARQPGHPEPQTPHRSPRAHCSGSLRDAKPTLSPGPPWHPACARWLDENAHPPHISQEEAADLPGPPSPPLGTQLVLPGPPPTRQVRGVMCPLAHTHSHPRKALDRPVQVGSALPTRATLKLGSHPEHWSPVTAASPASQGFCSEPSESPHSCCLQRPAHDHSRQKQTPPGEGWGQAGPRALPYQALAAKREGDRPASSRRGKPAPLQPTGGRGCGRKAAPLSPAAERAVCRGRCRRAELGQHSGREPREGQDGGRRQAWRRQPPPPCVPAGASPRSPSPPPSIENAPRAAFQK